MVQPWDVAPFCIIGIITISSCSARGRAKDRMRRDGNTSGWDGGTTGRKRPNNGMKYTRNSFFFFKIHINYRDPEII